jgi:hypothetical protein
MDATGPTESTRYDHLQIRCPRLGGEVTFAYCRREAGDIPCPRTIACWEPYFPVEAYLKTALTPAQWDRWSTREPKDKITTLMELIEEAKRRKQIED